MTEHFRELAARRDAARARAPGRRPRNAYAPSWRATPSTWSRSSPSPAPCTTQGRDTEAESAVRSGRGPRPRQRRGLPTTSSRHPLRRARTRRPARWTPPSGPSTLEPHDWRSHYRSSRARLIGGETAAYPRRVRRGPSRSVELAPHCASAHNLVGVCLSRLGDAPGAAAGLPQRARPRPAPHPCAEQPRRVRARQRQARAGGRNAAQRRSATRPAGEAAPRRPPRRSSSLLLGRRIMWSLFAVAIVLGVLLATEAPWWTRALAGTAYAAVLALARPRRRHATCRAASLAGAAGSSGGRSGRAKYLLGLLALLSVGGAAAGVRPLSPWPAGAGLVLVVGPPRARPGLRHRLGRAGRRQPRSRQVTPRASRVVAVDERLIESLTAAVRAAPGDLTLRLHLAGLLVDAGRGPEAVEHVATVLASEPGSTEALRADGPGRWGPPPTPRLPTPGAGRRAPSGDPSEAPTTFDWHAAESELGDSVGPMFVDGSTDEPGPAAYDVESAGVRLADVGGLTEVKKRLEASFLAPLRNPELRALYGKSLRGGLLLYGPPGLRQDLPRQGGRRRARRRLPPRLAGRRARHVHRPERAQRQGAASRSPAARRRACSSSTSSTRSARSGPSPATAACAPPSTSCSPSSTASGRTTRACSSSPPPTTRGTSTPRCAVRVASTARCSSCRPTSTPARRSCARTCASGPSSASTPAGWPRRPTGSAAPTSRTSASRPRRTR